MEFLYYLFAERFSTCWTVCVRPLPQAVPSLVWFFDYQSNPLKVRVFLGFLLGLFFLLIAGEFDLSPFDYGSVHWRCHLTLQKRLLFLSLLLFLHFKRFNVCRITEPGFFFSGGTQFLHLTYSKKGRARYLYMEIVTRHSDRLKKIIVLVEGGVFRRVLSLQKEERPSGLSLCGQLHGNSIHDTRLQQCLSALDFHSSFLCCWLRPKKQENSKTERKKERKKEIKKERKENQYKKENERFYLIDLQLALYARPKISLEDQKQSLI